MSVAFLTKSPPWREGNSHAKRDKLPCPLKSPDENAWSHHEDQRLTFDNFRYLPAHHEVWTTKGKIQVLRITESDGENPLLQLLALSSNGSCPTISPKATTLGCLSLSRQGLNPLHVSQARRMPTNSRIELVILHLPTCCYRLIVGLSKPTFICVTSISAAKAISSASWPANSSTFKVYVYQNHLF